MNEITWLDVIKIMIPVLTVILAGIFALFNLRHSIRLQAKNKWKEDFRTYVSDYLETLAKYNTYFSSIKRSIETEIPDSVLRDKFADLGGELLGRYNKIFMMLNFKSADSRDLADIFNKQHSQILNEDQEGIDIPKSIGEFSKIARKIHNKK